MGVAHADSIEQAIAWANDSRYGLSAAVFIVICRTRCALPAKWESGNIHINSGPMWRADLMPYGGLKESGFGKRVRAMP